LEESGNCGTDLRDSGDGWEQEWCSDGLVHHPVEAAAAAALRAFAPVTAGTAGGPGGHRSGGCHLDAELHHCEIVLRLLRDPQNLGLLLEHLSLLWEHLSLHDSKLRRHGIRRISGSDEFGW
jgi:hypothetical protein